MSPSDPTPLAQRLVEVATRQHYDTEETHEEFARIAVGNVLRKLAGVAAATEDGALSSADLRALADSIEKGAE